jgi:hypothetical protein
MRSTFNIQRLTLLLLLLVITAVAYALHWSFTVDDAAISFSYARNFAQGYGLGALFPGASRVEGYSNLLWVILLAAGTKLGLNTLLASKIIGLFFSLGVIAILYLLLGKFIHNHWMLLGLILLPVSLTFTFWSVSGLENSLYAFLILLAVYFLLHEDKSPAQIPFGSAISLVLVGMTRPEGLVYALAGAGYKIIQLAIHWRQVEVRRLLIKNLLSWLGIFLLGYGLFKAWHYAYFAAWWPNPIYAKAGWYKTDLQKIWFDPGGWTYLRGYFRTFAVVGMIPALLFGALVSLKGSQRVIPIFALATLALPLYTFDWMVNYRFLYPFLPFAVALLILAADELWGWIFLRETTATPEQIASHKPLAMTIYRIVALVLMIWFGISVARFAWVNLRLTERQLACGYAPMAETRCLDGKMYWSMGEVDQKYAELQNFAEQIGLTDPLYMIPDIGATSYLQNKRILDLAGLGDYQLARIREGSLLKQYVFQEQRPDFIMTHGVWTRRTDLTTFSAFRENYLPIEQGQDENGLVHGTFVRKDLLVSPAPTSLNTYLCEPAPGIFLVSLPASNSALEASTGQVPTPDPTNTGSEALAGQEIIPGLDSFWLASQSQTDNWNIEFTIYDQAGAQIYSGSEPLGYGWYPTSRWQSNEWFRQFIRLPEHLPAGDYNISLRLSGNSGASSDQDEGHPCNIVFTFPKNADDQDLPADQPQNLLVKSQSAWNAGDLDGLLMSLKDKNALQQTMVRQQSENWAVTGRDRVQNHQDWLAFGRTLRQAAGQAAEQKDWKRAYQLYLAAALANPDDAWAQRGLEQARRDYMQ